MTTTFGEVAHAGDFEGRRPVRWWPRATSALARVMSTSVAAAHRGSATAWCCRMAPVLPGGCWSGLEDRHVVALDRAVTGDQHQRLCCAAS
jgi:hypothetical protein